MWSSSDASWHWSNTSQYAILSLFRWSAPCHLSVSSPLACPVCFNHSLSGTHSVHQPPPLTPSIFTSLLPQRYTFHCSAGYLEHLVPDWQGPLLPFLVFRDDTQLSETLFRLAGVNRPDAQNVCVYLTILNQADSQSSKIKTLSHNQAVTQNGQGCCTFANNIADWDAKSLIKMSKTQQNFCVRFFQVPFIKMKGIHFKSDPWLGLIWKTCVLLKDCCKLCSQSIKTLFVNNASFFDCAHRVCIFPYWNSFKMQS